MTRWPFPAPELGRARVAILRGVNKTQRLRYGTGFNRDVQIAGRWQISA
jgi:hypothetical protein